MLSKPRQRAMPLMLEPFEQHIISRQSVGLGGERLAQQWCRFCPSFDIPKYRETLSDDKKTELDRRTNKLVRRAITNHLYKSSEFCWEVGAWHDVFGLIFDDEGLTMDKRPYEYLHKDDSGRGTVKTRIPDATFGLKSYDDYDLKRGYICEAPDCKEDHSSMQPDERLSQNRLRSMMYNPECGLVVDGVWGSTGLVFPFAVYEAKKRATSFEEAENQIYHACKTYLAMLDDLVRDPNNVAEYQANESSRYQLFAFTSCGSYWQVFVAWNFLDSCFVETLWEGDVKNFRDAFDLICIVDQIHDYAKNQHRPFIMKHLEAWYTREEKTLGAVKLSTPAPDATASTHTGSDDVDMVNYGLDDLGCDSENADGSLDSDEADGSGKSSLDLQSKRPGWLRVKLEAKYAKQEKAYQTRVRNQQAGNPA